MTIQNEVYREDYSGNDSTTSFPVSFYFFDDAHLRVLLLDAAGVETLQVLNTDYTVVGAGNPAGGSVEMVVPPATGETLTIIRDVPFTQLLDYIENDNFPAESHENGLDKLTMIVQQQQEEVDRTFRIAPSYLPATDFEMIPTADEILVWNPTGDKIITKNFNTSFAPLVDSLYYNQSDIKATAIVDGIEVFGNVTFDDSPAILKFDTGNPILRATGGAGIDFYYNNGVVLKAESYGIAVQDRSGSVPTIDMLASDGFTQLSRIRSNNGNLEMSVYGAGDYISLKYDDTITVREMFTATDGGNAGLYYNGLLALATFAEGMSVYATNGIDPHIFLRDDLGNLIGQINMFNNNLYLSAGRNVAGGGQVYLRAWNGSIYDFLLIGTQGGSVKLYYGGVPKFETTVNGFRVNDKVAEVTAGAGTPEGSVAAPVGSIFLRTDGGPVTSFYVKESGGGGNTGWVAK